MTANTNHSSTPNLTHCSSYHFSRNPIKSFFKIHNSIKAVKKTQSTDPTSDQPHLFFTYHRTSGGRGVAHTCSQFTRSLKPVIKSEKCLMKIIRNLLSDTTVIISKYKKLSYRTMRRAMSVEILSTAAQLYEKLHMKRLATDD